ncbi:MAG TPA: energy-coupling factor transporter transmembrane component T [Anaerolineae bacterium]|nr:energy-coupling factor transporter transmembrane component T [Anaerolineae bacterium]
MSEATMVDTRAPGRGQKWVRTFLFSMRIDSPLAGLHAITKFVLVLGVSLVLMGMISTARPDPLGCVLLVALAFLLLWLSGVIRWLFRSYLVVIFPMLLSLFLSWIAFNPNPGNRILFSRQTYSGVMNLGVSVAMIVFVGIIVGYYVFTKQLYWGILGAVVAALVISQTPLNLSWTFASFPFYQPLTLIISDATVYVAATKVLGYGAMVLMTFLLVLTTRDVEVVGALRKIPRMPYVICQFSSLMLRSLNIAMIDFSTVRQAQVARGVNVQKKNIVAKIRDMAYLTVPLIANMMRRSTEIADALTARGYEMDSKPTIYREVKPFHAVDYVLIIGTTVLVVGVLAAGLNITEVVLGLISRFQA